MTARRGGLGRGLGALIPSVVLERDDSDDSDGPPGVRPDADRNRQAPPGVLSAAPAPRQPASGASRVPGVALRELPLDAVRPNPRQPRTVFDDDALAELVASIREVGLLQPVVVRPADDGGFELVMGERRWRACRLAGLATVPAIVRDTADAAMLRDALLENIHREQLNPLEEAAAYQQLLEEFDVTHDELARRVGRSRSQVSNTIRLLGLPPVVQRRVAAGVLSAGHARALLAVPDAGRQEELAGRVVAEGLSVRAVEELVALGAPQRAPRRGRAMRPADPRLEGAAALLSDRLETRVRIEMGRARGTITVEFAGSEDLDRLLLVLAPPASS